MAADGCEAVIHLAAKVGLGVDIFDIDEYALHNDVGTAMTLRVAAEHRITRFVYASSMVVYGEGRYLCVRHGSMSPPPRHRNDLDAAALRPTMPAPAARSCGSGTGARVGATGSAQRLRGDEGPRGAAGDDLESGDRRDEWPRSDSTMSTVLACRAIPRTPEWRRSSPTACGAASRRESSRMAVSGATSFMSPMWPRPCVAAVQAPLPAKLTPLNIGTPWVTTVGEMATRAEPNSRLDRPPIVTGDYRLGDVRHITADCSAAERVLGWRARIDLRTGLANL